MKKMMFSLVAVAALALVSCGSKDAENKEGGPSVCDCVKMGEEAAKEMKGANGDEAKLKEITEKYEKKAEECKKLGEGKSDEEKKKMMEEAAKCK
jgi:hypothetical protein